MKITIQTIFLALLSLFFAQTYAFGQLYEVSLDERIEKSSLIVEGKVVEAKCYRADNGDIYTANKVELVSILKGDYREKFLTVTTWGGELDGEMQSWTHLLTLDKGDYGVFFLEPTQVPSVPDQNFSTSFDVYAGVQGFLALVQNEAKAWVAHEPFHTYADIETDLYGYIARKAGQILHYVNQGGDEKRSGVRYHFTDIVFNGTEIGFSVYVNSLVGTKSLYKSGLQFGYNPAFFGSNIATSGNLVLALSLPGSYSLSQSNVTSSNVKIEVASSGSLTGLTTIGATEQLLAKGKITIQSIAADPGITYNLAAMQAMSKFYESGTAQVFDTVIVEGDWRPVEQFAPSIDSIRPPVLRAGTDDILRIYGKNFGTSQGSSYVEFTNAYAGITNGVNWIESLATDYNLWSDTKIEVFVPSVAKGGDYTGYAGSGKIRVKVGGSTKTSTESIKVKFGADNRALLDIGATELKRKKVRLIGDFGEDNGYTLYYNQNFKNLGGAVPAFERALCTWIQSSNINFRVKEYADIDQIYQQYACQIILGSLPAGANSSTKAITEKSYYLGCQDASGNVIKGSLKKFDIYFRESANWFVNQVYDPTLPFSYWEANQDLESFSLHELGHAQLLLHVNESNDVMYYEIVTPKRTLHSDDVEGGGYIKGISIIAEPGCSVNPIVPNGDCGLIPTIDIGNQEGLIKLDPNPAYDQISFDSPYKIQEIRVFNSLGAVIYNFSPNELRPVIDVSNINIGFYFAIIKTNNKYYALKFEKI